MDRMLPYWFDSIIPDLRAYETVLIASHGHTLRALVKHLSDISEGDVAQLTIASGVPLIYDIDPSGRRSSDTPVEDRYLR